MTSRSQKDGPNEEGLGVPNGPWMVLQAAIKAVPAVKYALGIAGIGAVVAILAGFQVDPRIGIFGIIIIIALMFILLLFARLTEAAPKQLIKPALLLTWAFSFIIICVTAFLATGYFFAWPRPLDAVPDLLLHVGPEPSVTIKGPEPGCENTQARCARELRLNKPEPGSVAQSEQRWYKFQTTVQRGGHVHVLVRNLDLDPQIILTATLLNKQEVELKTSFWGLASNAVLDFQSLKNDTYYVRITAKMYVTSRVLLRFEIQISEL